MSRAALLALGAVTATVACGGQAEDQRGTGDGDGEGDGDGGTTGVGGTYDVVAPPYGSPPETGGAPSYRPETDVDFAGDGHFIEGGSLEGGQGYGFDTCHTRNPGVSIVEGAAADGNFFLSFTPMDGDYPAAADGSEAQAAFINDEVPLQPGVPLSVYFEIRNLSDVAPVGELSFAPVFSCELYEPATTVPLIALEPGPEWETRCIELVPEQEQRWLGIWVTGEEFAIGIDAVRLGPPCN